MNRKIALAFLIPAALALLGLTQASPPPKFGIPWGNSAGSSYIRSIPTPSQIGTQNCAASLTDGFPPLTFVPSGSGGCPPFGQDFNGILKQLSQWGQWQAAGGPVFYDSAFATASGGYPSGAIVMSSIVPGDHWMSTADSNTTNPDAGGANWVQAPNEIPVGTPVQALTTVVPTGYVSANGTTIGDASSNATGRANADTLLLFVFVWNACPNAQCPILTSGGAGSTRGGSCTLAACADYAAHKALTVQNMNGLGVMGADSQSGTTSTFLSGVPSTIGSRTVPGSILGENLHSLTTAENGAHSHGVTDPGHTHGVTGGIYGGATHSVQSGTTTDTPTNGTLIAISSATTGITVNSSGSGTAHNTVQRGMVVYWNLKL